MEIISKASVDASVDADYSALGMLSVLSGLFWEKEEVK